MLRGPCTLNPAIRLLQFALPWCQKAAGILWYKQSEARDPSEQSRGGGGDVAGQPDCSRRQANCRREAAQPPQKKPAVRELLPCRRPHQQNCSSAACQHGPRQDQGSILAPPQRADFQQSGISSLMWGRACHGVVLYLSPHWF